MEKRLRFHGALCAAVLCCLVFSSPAGAAPIFFNGFEADITGWSIFGGSYNPTRVASGTNGIPSADGSWHAQTSTAAGNWGGYALNPACAANACAAGGFPTGGYKTSVDIYLDVDGSWADNTRFDFDSAINRQDGTHLRDFIFNAAFFSSADVTGPGAGTNRFVVSASNNSQPGSAYAKNPDKSPIAITETGWYTFEHTFRDDGGALAVDMRIYDDTNALVNSWTLSDPTDLIATVVGGNRYGWFNYNEFSVLAFDNTSLETIPEPTTVLLLGAGVAGLAVYPMKRRQR